jgi:hypothetical protein
VNGPREEEHRPDDRCLETVLRLFRKLRDLGESAMVQVPDDALHTAPVDGANSVAVLVRHLAGNMRSLWTDILTTDGEKPWRQRDEEFEEGSELPPVCACWRFEIHQQRREGAPVFHPTTVRTALPFQLHSWCRSHRVGFS